jgi:hypothetical protein
VSVGTVVGRAFVAAYKQAAASMFTIGLLWRNIIPL